jgi:DNA end-binding protein Ku
MSLSDKISGRVKKAAGDLLGNEALHRQGSEEEHKSEAKQRLAEDEAQLERQREKVDRRAEEVSALEGDTSAAHLAEAHSREELEEQARALDIEGRSKMTKEELAQAIKAAR